VGSILIRSPWIGFHSRAGPTRIEMGNASRPISFLASKWLSYPVSLISDSLRVFSEKSKSAAIDHGGQIEPASSLAARRSAAFDPLRSSDSSRNATAPLRFTFTLSG